MNAEHNTPKQTINPAELQLASQLAGNFFGMLKAVNLYPKGHQMLLNVLEKFFNYLNYILGEKQSATFRIFENKLYVQDVPLPHDKPPGIEEFIEEMQKRYIRQISFSPGVTITDITALVDVLTADPEELSKSGGPSLALAQGGAQATKIIEYYYRRHASVDQERLLSLTNSEIFRFFTDKLMALDIKQARILYDLLKEPMLISALTKVAAQYMMREPNTDLSESRLILNIINRIKTALIDTGVSEEAEIQVIFKDVIGSFDAHDLFNLIFENPENEIIRQTDALTAFSSKADEETTARMITEKIQTSKEDNRSIINHTKNVLGKLFVDRSSFLNFLPMFKEKLQDNISKQKAKTILNDVCAAFAPGFSVEEDVELALGTISDSELSDIVAGLDMLKSVHPDKKTIEKEIIDFNAEYARLQILKTVLLEDEDPEFFKQTTSKLVNAAQAMMQGDRWDESRKMFTFFQCLASPEGGLPEHRRGIIASRIQAMPSLLVEKLIINILFEASAEDIEKNFQEFFALFGEKLVSLLIKIYARAERLPQEKLIRDFILKHYTPASFKRDIDLQKELSQNLMRIIDLMQQIKEEGILPLLWEVTFHENAIIAQRALKLIAIRGSNSALALLLKTLTHPQFHIQIAGIEYLGSYKSKEARSALLPIAQGRASKSDDEQASNELRITALKSLMLLDEALAKELLIAVLKKKRWLFFPVEPKQLRLFAKQQLKKKRNK